MLLGTLAASILENILARKRKIPGRRVRTAGEAAI